MIAEPYGSPESIGGLFTPRPQLSIVRDEDPEPEETEEIEEEVEPIDPGTVTLRDYQRAAVDAVRAQFDARNEDRVRATLVVSATGTGKTVIMAEAARRVLERGHGVLWLAHRDELLRQGQRALSRMGITGLIEKAGERARPGFGTMSKCVIASVPTLQGERLQQWAPDAFGLIIVDEAHHSPAQTYRAILDHFRKARVVGFTATAERLDGVNVGRIYESLAFEYSLPQAVKDGWLVRPKIAQVVTDPPIDLRNIRVTAGDLNSADLEREIMANMDNIVNETRELLQGRKTIAFTPDIYSAYSLAEAYKMVGLKATYIASKDHNGRPMSFERRRQIAREFEAGTYDLVANPMAWTEGVDLPFVDTVMNLRPTKSTSLLSQMLGRATRLLEGKDHCLFVDLSCRTDIKLASPVDLFDDSGRSDEVLRKAKELVENGEEKDPLRALELAEELHQIDLQKKIALQERQARFTPRIFDPLAAMELIGVTRKESDNSWFDTRPADDKDKRFLDKYYNKPKKDGTPRQYLDVSGLSWYEAKNLKRKTLKRIKDGLCNHNQIALLIAKGMAPEQAQRVKFNEVGAALAALQGR